MKPYKIIKTLHLWLGLTVGAIVSFSGITGSLYLLQPEIAAYLTAKELNIDTFNKTKISYQKNIQTVAKLTEIHGDSIKKIQLPYRKNNYIILTFLNGTTSYFHPEKGVYLGNNLKINSFFEILLQLHRNLCFKPYGSYIIGVSSLIFCFLILISGFLLWRRSYKKRWKKGFTINWYSSKKKFNYNLHKVAGIYFIIPLIMLSFSGAYFTFHKEYRILLSVLPAYKIAENSSIHKTKIGGFFDIEKQTKRLFPDDKLWSIYYPSKKDEYYRFRFINTLKIESGLRKSTDIFTDKNSRIVKINSFYKNPLSLRITAQMYPIHIGESFGFFHRILVFITGFIPLILYITGIRFYLYKKRR